MANSETGTSTGNILGGEYHVFLSFRGGDTRDSFANILHQALEWVGIRVFIDDKGLQPGDKISELLQEINNSQLYIPIFSKNYPSSLWCLDELAEMVENTSKHKEDGKKKVILPIFYDVEPDDVILETQLYKDAILKLKKEMKDQKCKLSSKRIKTWRRALKEIGGTKGLEMKKLSPAKLIQDVVDTVIANRKTRRRRVTRDLVGMQDRIADIEELLDIDSRDDVRLIGIYGMGGIGKTTLVKIIFNKLSCQFGRNCSFLGDVRETEKNKGLVELQKRLLSDISNSRVAHDINDIEIGINTIEETICNKKVLIVLDDVDKAYQIQKLIGEKSFCPGTRILVTTKDRGVLNIGELEYGFKNYRMVELSSKDALRLFSLHAFDKDSPPIDYYTLSKKIVSTADGLPLALVVIGSSLFQKRREIWEEMLPNLKETLHKDVLAKLKISYDTLEPNEQQIFLDIACFFVGENKTNPMYMWKDCNFYPYSAIDILIDRCMIKELDNDSFWMHDQLRNLGTTIAKTKRIGLWHEDDIIHELASKKSKESFKALSFSASRDRKTVTSEQIKWFPHLRILWLYEVICQGDFTGCLSELRWINLRYAYSAGAQAPNNQRLKATNLLHLENAVVVNLSELDITKKVLRSLIEGASKLKVLTIKHNTSIHKMPTFPKHSDLKELTIDEFESLKEIDCSIGQLRCLTKLRIEHCCKLRGLPEQIGELENLQHLSLKSCYNLIELPDSVSKLVLLIKLDVSYTSIARLPDSIGRLPSLSSIDGTCTSIGKLPGPMTKLLDPCNSIQELPKFLGSLTILRLTSASLQTVPNLSYFTNLVELLLSNDRQNESQAGDLGWIGSLTKLSKLHVCFPNVRAPTTELGSLSLLKELTLYGLDLPTFKHLPSNLIVLELYETCRSPAHLDVLESSERSCIQDYRSPERLVCQPEEPRCNELQAAELIDHWRGEILFPESQKMLMKLCLSGFPEVQAIHFEIPLESLGELTISKCSSLESLRGLSNSKYLRSLEIKQCSSLTVVNSIDELEFLYRLRIEYCRSVGMILNPLSSKIPDNCVIVIIGSGKLPDCRISRHNWMVDHWKSYREKIRSGKKQAWSSGIEIADSETETGDSMQKTDSETETGDSMQKTDSETGTGNSMQKTDSETGTGNSMQKTGRENKEKKRKRKTESAKQQGRRKRRKLQKKTWVRLFHPIISLCRTRKMKRRKERARQSAKELAKRKKGTNA